MDAPLDTEEHWSQRCKKINTNVCVCQAANGSSVPPVSAAVFPCRDAIILSVCSHFAKTPSETMKSIHAPYFSRTIDTLTRNGQRPGSTLKWDWLHGSVTDIFKAKLSILPAVLEDIDWPFKDPQNIVFCDNIAKHQTSQKKEEDENNCKLGHWVGFTKNTLFWPKSREISFFLVNLNSVFDTIFFVFCDTCNHKTSKNQTENGL